ncbi:MAG: hypothetical protein VW964_03040 [Ilumatobacter sp.]
MREIFSIRFFAAVGAVILSFLVVSAIVGGAEPVAEEGADADTQPRRVDLVERVERFEDEGAVFSVVDGAAASSTVLILDERRSARIVAGTPGEDRCPIGRRIGACALVADLLGESVVWFRLEPVEPGGVVEFGPIVALDDEVATLADGLQLPYAPVLTRRCDTEFESFSAFRRELGEDFVSRYTLSQRRLTDVICTV